MTDAEDLQLLLSEIQFAKEHLEVGELRLTADAITTVLELWDMLSDLPTADHIDALREALDCICDPPLKRPDRESVRRWEEESREHYSISGYHARSDLDDLTHRAISQSYSLAAAAAAPKAALSTF